MSEAFLQAVQENTRKFFWTGKFTTNVDHCFQKAVYAWVNFKEAYCPDEIADRSILINADPAAGSFFIPKWHNAGN